MSPPDDNKDEQGTWYLIGSWVVLIALLAGVLVAGVVFAFRGQMTGDQQTVVGEARANQWKGISPNLRNFSVGGGMLNVNAT